MKKFATTLLVVSIAFFAASVVMLVVTFASGWTPTVSTFTNPLIWGFNVAAWSYVFRVERDRS